MNVKGIIYGVAKNAMVTIFGEERWNAFMTKLAAKDKYFQQGDYVHYPRSTGKSNLFS